MEYYNNIRLNSAIGYVVPKAKLEGREKQIFVERDQKLEAARESRKAKRSIIGEKDLGANEIRA